MAATKYLDDLEFHHMELHKGLEYVGVRILEIITTNRFLSFHALVKSEAELRPEIGQKFYAHISQRSYKLLAAYFKKHIDAGELKRISPQRLAQHYWAMMLHNLYLQLEFKAMDELNRNQVKRHVKRTVDEFLTFAGTDSTN